MVDIHPQTPDEITPEWLTSALKKSGILFDSNVLSFQKESLGEGRAWLSSILKLEVNYTQSSKYLPKSFILKMLSKSRFREAGKRIFIQRSL